MFGDILIPIDGSDVQPAKDAGRGIVAPVGDRVRENDIPVETDVRSGIPHVEILEYASQKDVDLIAMGRQGRGQLEDFLIGSVTTNVVRKADVPVLTVRMVNCTARMRISSYRRTVARQRRTQQVRRSN